MKDDFPSILSHIAVLAGIIPLTIGLLVRKYFNSSEKILFYLICVSALSDFIGSILEMRNINNMFVFHIYTVFEFTLISIFYIKVISNPKITSLIVGLILLFLIVATFDFLKKIKHLDDFSTTTESIIVMLYAVFGYFLLLKNPVQTRVISIPLFWFNTAFLLYFAGSLFLFIFGNFIQHHYKKGVFHEIWAIHSVMGLTLYILISIGFWKTKAR